MADSGLLSNVFPELLALKNYRLPGEDPQNLFEQTNNSYLGLEKLLDAGDQLRKVSGDRIFQDIDAARATLLKWAILFHVRIKTSLSTYSWCMVNMSLSKKIRPIWKRKVLGIFIYR